MAEVRATTWTPGDPAGAGSPQRGSVHVIAEVYPKRLRTVCNHRWNPANLRVPKEGHSRCPGCWGGRGLYRPGMTLPARETTDKGDSR